MFKKLFSLYTV